MAVSNIEKSQLRLVFETGIDPETQEPVFKSKNFNHVQIDATASSLNKIAELLASLQEYELYQVQRVDHSNIESQ